MKKALFLILLLPFIGLSQTVDIVKWTTNSNTSAAAVPISATYISGNNFTVGTAVNLSYDWGVFNVTNWMSGSTLQNEQNKYAQFSFQPVGGATATVSSISFPYRGNYKKATVAYSKSSSFSSPVTVGTYDLNFYGGDAVISASFSTPVSVSATEGFYVRIYVYDRVSDQFKFTLTSNNTYPKISGTVTAPQPLSGIKTIGAGAGNDFTTITSAVTAIKAAGISGPVTFILKDALYTNPQSGGGETFPIEITAISGASATNTITFKPDAGVNSKIEVLPNYISGSPYQIQAAFKISGGDFITFEGSNNGTTTRNLSIVNSSYSNPDSDSRTVFWIASQTNNGATDITIKNCIIKQTVKNGSYAACGGIISCGNTLGINDGVINSYAETPNNNLLIKGNDFVNVKQGVTVMGNPNNPTQNIKIQQNDLGAETNSETIIQPAYLSSVKEFYYTENYVYNLRRETTAGALISSGIVVAGNSSNGFILKNNMSNLIKTTTESTTFAGIVLSSTNSNTNILVANNFILNVAGNCNGGSYLNGHGIVISNGGGYKIYHNTVSLNTNQTGSGGYSSCLYVGNTDSNVNGISNLDVMNNIFANNQTSTGTVRSAITVAGYASNINSYFSNLNYNDYYSTDKFGYIAYWQQNNSGANPGQVNTFPGTYYVPDFATWKTVTGKDANSKNVNPTFMSATDLHISSSSANNGFADAGTNAIYSTVSKDIDGQVRKTATPDMGADEFGAAPTAVAGTPGNNPGIYCSSSTTFTGYVNGVEQWTNGNPSSDKDVIFNANYTQDGGELNACSIYVLAGKAVLFTGNSTAVVQHSVNVDNTNNGSLTFESGSNLIQVEDDQNTGVATIKRMSGMLKRLDYTLWCAPVTDYREGVTTVNGVTTTEYQSFIDFSPLTSTTPSRFYYYNTATDQFLEHNPVLDRFVKGKCALIRMPNSLPSIPGYNAGTARTQFEGKFEGTPNTGTIRLPLTYVTVNGEEKGYNGVGNPYPSPISIAAFLQENSVNNNAIIGGVWLWRKTNNPLISSYAYCTIAGYVANEGGNNSGNTILPVNGAAVPRLNTGQGFIVKATGANKEVIFRNNMREDSHSTVFFKTMDDGPAAVVNGKVWLNVTGGDNFSQVLVAYDGVTSLGYDNGYEGDVFAGAGFTLYSLLPQQNGAAQLAIQARGSFAQTDVVPLGYLANAAGTYEFTIDHAEGIFAEGQDVYIKDNLLGITHKLNDGNYTFTTDAGNFETRFEVTYVAQGELGTDVPVVDANEVIIYKDNQQVKVTSPEDINSITVYDMLGRTLFTQNKIDGTVFSTPQLEVGQQVVIVTLTLDNNQVVSKKIMM